MPSQKEINAAQKLRDAHAECKKVEEEVVALQAVQDEAKKQEEKNVSFMISGPGGLVSRYSLPIEVVWC